MISKTASMTSSMSGFLPWLPARLWTVFGPVQECLHREQPVAPSLVCAGDVAARYRQSDGARLYAAHLGSRIDRYPAWNWVHFPPISQNSKESPT